MENSYNQNQEHHDSIVYSKHELILTFLAGATSDFTAGNTTQERLDLPARFLQQILLLPYFTMLQKVLLSLETWCICFCCKQLQSCDYPSNHAWAGVGTTLKGHGAFQIYLFNSAVLVVALRLSRVLDLSCSKR